MTDFFSRKLYLWILLGALLSLHAVSAQIIHKIYIYHSSKGTTLFTDIPTQNQNYHLQKIIIYRGRPTAWRSCYGLSHKQLMARAQHYKTRIEQAAHRNHISQQLVSAVIAVESCYDPKAVSSVGAQGLMQLMPATAQTLGLHHPFNARANILAGTLYLHRLLDQFHHNLHLALAAYNAGPGAVEKYNGIPPFKQTRHFVKAVLSRYHQTP